MAKQKLTAAKVRKKIWVELRSPEAFGSVHIGDTHVYEPQQVIGKTVTVNLMALTRDPKKQYADMQFEVSGLKDNVGLTKFRAYMMSPSAVKRLMRRRNDKIADSFYCITADARRVRIKYFLIAKSQTSASVRASLRNETRDLLTDTVRKISFETLLRDIVSFKFQTFIKEEVSGIFPLQLCEIKYAGLELAKREKAAEQIPEAEYSVNREKKSLKPVIAVESQADVEESEEESEQESSANDETQESVESDE